MLGPGHKWAARTQLRPWIVTQRIAAPSLYGQHLDLVEQGWQDIGIDACRILLNPKLIKESGQHSIQDQHANKRLKHGEQCLKLVHEPLLSVRSGAGYREEPIWPRLYDVPMRPPDHTSTSRT